MYYTIIKLLTNKKFWISLVFLHFQLSYSAEWSITLDSINSFGSIRSADLNNDNVEDIVIGGGKENGRTNKIVAINGIDGSILWQTYTENEIYTSPRFIDINKDQTPDIIMGGRLANLYALDGKNGHIIWQFYTDTVPALEKGWYNFYEPQFIDDVNDDDIMDILITNGGNPTFGPLDSIRPPASFLIILNTVDGSILFSDTLPDRKETYMPPLVYDLNNNGKDELILGSGGETIGGALWISTLQDFLIQNSIEATLVYHDSQKGFIQPPVLTEITNDNIIDIIIPAFNGKIIAINGSNLSTIWHVDLPGYELYTGLSVGNFNSDSIPDFFVIGSRGTYPSYDGFIQIIIDGATGNHNIIDSSGAFFQIGSGIVYDKDSNNIDEIAVSYNYFESGEFRNYIKEYNLSNQAQTILTDTLSGINFGSTPYLKDIDKDSLCELFYLFNEFTEDNKLHIEKKSTNIKSNMVKWGSYLGNRYNNTYLENREIVNDLKTNNNHSLNIYPNPFLQYINNNTLDEIYTIYDLQLRPIIKSIRINKQIDLSLLPNGTYIIYGERCNCSQKIIKMAP
jgi:outer membrane protein assembly factor BamB